jgi:hypothetical protein
LVEDYCYKKIWKKTLQIQKNWEKLQIQNNEFKRKKEEKRATGYGFYFFIKIIVT